MKYFIIALLLIFFVSCKKDDIKPSWDADLLVPIAYTNINISNLLADSIKKINNDQSVSLIYQTQLPSFTLDTIIRLNDTSFQYTASLNNLSLNPYTYSYRVSMGSIALKDKEQNGSSSPIYTAIMTAHNTGQPTQLTSFGPYNYDSIKVNMGNYFKYIYINEATLEITINNQLPIALSNLAFSLKKVSTSETLINDAFSLIPPNSQQTRSITLSNIVLDSLLMAFFTVSSPGTFTPVIIDTNQSATAQISLKNLKIDSAIARFPSQELLKYNDILRFSLPDSMQVSELWLRSGTMELEFQNTITQNLYVNFSLPAAKKNGQPFQLQITVPASDGVNPTQIQTQIDLSQYRIKFRGIHEFEVQQGDLNNNQIIDPDTVNSLYYKVTASIDSTGEFITLTKNDSITAKCRFLNIIPDYVKGFFGFKEVSIDSSTNFTFLNNIFAEGIHFDQALFSICIENQIGTTAKAYIQELTAKNIQQNQQVSLSGSILSTPLQIQKPIDPVNTQIDVSPTVNTLNINHQNSNIHDLVSVLPNRLNYKLRLQLNEQIPLPTPSQASDFLYYGDGISVKLNAELPLSFYVNSLILTDTVEVKINSININNIQDGNIILHARNYFPLDINVFIYTLDSNKVVYDSLHTTPIFIQAGIVNSATNKVETPKDSKNIIPFTPQKLNKILKAKYFYIKAKFNSIPQYQHIKIFNDYMLQLKLIGDFNYIIQNNKQ